MKTIVVVLHDLLDIHHVSHYNIILVMRYNFLEDMFAGIEGEIMEEDDEFFLVAL